MDSNQVDGGSTVLQTINITAHGTNGHLLRSQKAHVVVFQEHRIPEAQAEAVKASYAEDQWAAEIGPLIPSLGGPAGGVGIISRQPHKPTEPPARTEEFERARRTCRAAKYIVPLTGGAEIMVFVIYGVPRGHESAEARAVTDSIIRAIENEAEGAETRLMAIMGDVNADPQDLPTLKRMTEETWVDVGQLAAELSNTEVRPTCRAGGKAKPTRRDFIFVNDEL